MSLEVLIPKDTAGYLDMRASYASHASHASHEGYLLSSTLQVKAVPNMHAGIFFKRVGSSRNPTPPHKLKFHKQK